MYSETLIYNPDDLTKRCFVHTYINGKRWRFYNGSSLGMSCFPNKSKNIVDRKRELKRLDHCLQNKLSKGWLPDNPIETRDCTVDKAFEILDGIIRCQKYSDVYKRDLLLTMKDFLQHLQAKKISGHNLSQISTKVIEEFLLQFNSSGTYYMNKRRFLSCCFSKLISHGYCDHNPVKKSTKRKAKAVLNQAYKAEEIIPVLNFLKQTNMNVYLCSLLIYGTLLRPHQEIRLLTRKDISENLDYIILDGYRNKSGSIRKAPIPEYVKKVLLEMGINDLGDADNIFSRKPVPLNKHYFSLMWSRCKKKMLGIGLVNSKQTLYSFRHAAAIDVFNRCKDLNMIQSMFQHSNLSVSLTYLRSIGQDKMFEHKDLPRLNQIENP